MKKTAIATAMVAALGASAVQAGSIVMSPVSMTTDAANFTMMDDGGAGVGGTNDASMVWDGTAFTSITDYTGTTSVANITAGSTTLFFNHNWSAHNIQAFATGTYTFDTALEGGNPEAGNLTLTVPAGMLGMHMLFDWNGNLNIDVVVLGSFNTMFGSGNGFLANPGYVAFSVDGACSDAFGTAILGAECLFDGPGFGSEAVKAGPLVDATQIWGLASVDQIGGDGISGTPMAPGGPFAGFNANFNANLVPVPVPAAVWLFGSGLIGLVGVARRRKSA